MFFSLEEPRSQSLENSYRFTQKQTSGIYETVAPPLPVRFSGESYLSSAISFETALPNLSKDDYYVTPNIAFKEGSFQASSTAQSAKELVQKEGR